MKKSIFVLGYILLLLGIVMACFGAGIFSYRGNSLSPFMSELGKYCFLGFFPVIGIGAFLLFVSALIKKR